MDPHIFWMYSLAAAGLTWGAFGLRFGLSVLAANAALAFILYALPPGSLSPALANILPFGYPFYWGAAFFLLRWLDILPVPALPVVLRVVLGTFLALFFVVLANKDTLGHSANILYATYLAPVAERPALLREEFSHSTYSQVCLDSNATLMRLAITARDKEVAGLLLDVFSPCHSASATIVQAVKPLFDDHDLESLEFLMANGLKPSTLISGSAYRGTALSYAATVVGSREIVLSLIRHDPMDARMVPFLPVLEATLEEQDNDAMLSLLREAGILPAPGSAPASSLPPEEEPKL